MYTNFFFLLSEYKYELKVSFKFDIFFNVGMTRFGTTIS